MAWASAPMPARAGATLRPGVMYLASRSRAPGPPLRDRVRVAKLCAASPLIAPCIDPWRARAGFHAGASAALRAARSG